MKSSSFTIPTSVVDLYICNTQKPVTLSGTEKLTKLHLPNENFNTTPCQKLQELNWDGDTLAEKALPLPIADIPTLSKLIVHPVTVDTNFRFPTQLTSLWVIVYGKIIDISFLTPLTRLQDPSIESTRRKTCSTCPHSRQ